MDLRYVCSDILTEYNKEKHFGCFVYLDVEDNDINGYRKGLYVGGNDGWERLTNNEGDIVADPTSYIPLPLNSNPNFTYDGLEKTFTPLNWDGEDGIGKYCYLTNNVGINAGTYVANVLLKFDGWTWADGTNNSNGVKELEFVIKQKVINTATIKVSKETITYGDDFPYVISVSYQGVTFVEGVDFDVEYHKGNTNERNYVELIFKNNYTGTVEKTITVSPKKIELPILNKKVYGYTGEVLKIVPDNWDLIQEYCDINFSSNEIKDYGDYNMIISIKKEYSTNYSWSDGTKSPISIPFSISYVSVDVPIWEKLYSEFDGYYHEYYPMNWEKISEYCNITGNNLRDAGDYEITISLKNDSLKWNDSTHSKAPQTETFKIKKKEIELPDWRVETAHYYTGDYYECTPVNWDYLKEYCEIEGNKNRNAGDYTTKVSLRDTDNYIWKNNGKNPQTREWKILRAISDFIAGPYLEGGNDVNDEIKCIAVYADGSVPLTYLWYRSRTGSMNDAELIQQGDLSLYVVTPEDVDHYLICQVYAPMSENFEGCDKYVVSKLKITKIGVKYTLGFENDLYEDTIFKSQNTYTLPGITGIVDGDHPEIEWRLVSGSDVVDIWSPSGVLWIKGIGDAVLETTVDHSSTYQYIPNKIRFTLHVYDGDMIMWGMYDKDAEDNEQMVLSRGEIPANAIVANSKETDKGIHSLMLRSDFPFTKPDGTQQDYYGWYILVPTNKVIEIIDENSGNVIEHSECQITYMKNGIKQTIYTDSEGRQYRAYGKFNVAKTSDNWMLHTLIKSIY